MDDGEVDFSEQDVLCGSSSLVCDDSSSAGMESFLDEILKNTHTCTHTHTCNPPGPDNTHTHTCFHTHTQLFASPDDDQQAQPLQQEQEQQLEQLSSKQAKKRPLGNREAVRKYREKKKAHAAYLEEQVEQLKVLNQQLLKRLQGQAALEAEVARLRALLSEFRGRIDAEFASFPYKRSAAVQHDKLNNCLQPLPGGFYLNSVSVPCDADVPCFHGESATALSHQQQQHHPQHHQPCDYVSESCQALAANFGETDGL